MRIYAVADLHGRVPRMARVRETVGSLNPDVLVVAGDITNYSGAEEVISLLNDMPVPVLAVRGNTDLPRVERLFARHRNISPLHLNRVSVHGVPFVGLSGTVPVPFWSLVCLREDRALMRLRPLVTDDTIVVVHTPPRGVLDEAFGRFHAGSHGLAKAIAGSAPAAVICGHIHERPGARFLGRTLVVNCNVGRRGGGALIEVSGGGNISVRMLSHFPS